MPALILDCDGVLAETERDLHRPAFNRAFSEFGLDVRWSGDEYGRRLRVGGGKERIATLFTPPFLEAHGLSSDAATLAELAARIHARKTALFEELVAEGRLVARPGVGRLAREARDAGWPVAVASTSAEAAVRAVIAQVLDPDLTDDVHVFAGDAVPAKKPDPAIYELAVRSLGVDAGDAVAIEDSRNGLLAATAAGLACVVTTSEYTRNEDFAGAALVVPSLGEPSGPGRVTLADLAVLVRGDG
jgi:HAD superfamily hydrolase (TIGR01509 family)